MSNPIRELIPFLGGGSLNHLAIIAGDLDGDFLKGHQVIEASDGWDQIQRNRAVRVGGGRQWAVGALFEFQSGPERFFTRQSHLQFDGLGIK